jgi:hypothetical protein
MVTVSTEAGAYQDLDRIRQRLDYRGRDFFDNNEELQFDELLVQLEAESRGIFETLWGDETPLEETERVDEFRATDDAAIPLVYPITDIREVETRQSPGDDYETFDADRYTFDAHRLILGSRSRALSTSRRDAGYSHRRFAARPTWVDFAESLRVTYDRGFGTEPPEDIQSIQIGMIENALRQRKLEQTVAAASPDELVEAASMDEFLTDEIRQRVSDVTSPGRATMSV